MNRSSPPAHIALSCYSAPDLTPDRRRRLTPANTDEAPEPSLECPSRVGSMLEADGGQSSALIYNLTIPSELHEVVMMLSEEERARQSVS
jgi:hypothetical protein